MTFKVKDRVSFTNVDRHSGTGILHSYNVRSNKWLVSLCTIVRHSTKIPAPFKTWWVPTAELVPTKPTSYKQIFLDKLSS